MKNQLLRKVTFPLLFFLTILLQAQEVHLASGGLLTISSGDFISINNNATVDAAANIIINSDVTSSGSLLVSGSLTGNITYKRYIRDNDWHLVSAPVTSQNIPAFVTNVDNSIVTNPSNGNYAVAYYKNTNPSGQNWVYHNASPSTVTQETLTDFVNGQGYTTKRTTAGEFTFSGGMANTDVLVPLTTISGTHYWSCVGNPYPSYLPVNNSADAVNILAQNIDILEPNFAALYFWNGTEYEPINHVSAALQLPPGQAFLVHAKDESEVFTFTKSLQNHQNGTENFFRNQTNSTPTPTIIVNLSNGTSQKTTEIKYLSNATTGLDIGYDAGTYEGGGTPSLSIDTHLVSDSQGLNFMLQCLPNQNYEDMIVPLSIRADAQTTLTFSATISDLPEGIHVYIEDRLKNTLEKINETDTFQILIESTQTGIGRFFLHTSLNNTLSIEDITAQEAINIYTTDYRTLRILGLEENYTAVVKLYSITGKEVLHEEFISNEVKEIRLPKSLRTGVYIAKLVSKGSSMTRKIIIR